MLLKLQQSAEYFQVVGVHGKIAVRAVSFAISKGIFLRNTNTFNQVNAPDDMNKLSISRLNQM